MKTLVVGLGNPILTDDGVGVKVALAVEALLAVAKKEDIKVTEASVGGLRLMEMMIGYDRVILIDALVSRNGNQPGTVHRLTLDDLRTISPTQHSASAHDTSLVTALETGRCLGLHLPAEIVIYAIDVENVTDFSDEPTAAVADAIPRAAATVLSELCSR
jgi:hydrogenase maturation protease